MGMNIKAWIKNNRMKKNESWGSETRRVKTKRRS